MLIWKVRYVSWNYYRYSKSLLSFAQYVWHKKTRLSQAMATQVDIDITYNVPCLKTYRFSVLHQDIKYLMKKVFNERHKTFFFQIITSFLLCIYCKSTSFSQRYRLRKQPLIANALNKSSSNLSKIYKMHLWNN